MAGQKGKAVEWEADTNVSCCPHCGKDFSIKIRKHHCRACGMVVCGSCSTNIADVVGYDKKERVCDPCYSGSNSSKSNFCDTLLMMFGCVDTPEVAERKERRKKLLNGASFSRKRGVLFKKQRVSVRLQDNIIYCSPIDSADPVEEYPLVDVEEATSCGPIAYLKSSIGTNLLELEATSTKACESWVKGLNEIINDRTENSVGIPIVKRTKQSKAAKEKYFVQKNIEMNNRKEAAEKKKAKIMGSMQGGPGLKYSALAMANRE